MNGPDLKALRDRHGWSQQQAAEILNASLERRYTSATLSQWELGKRSIPGPVVSFLQALELETILPPGPGPEPSPGPGVEGPPGASERTADEPPGPAAPLGPGQPPIGPSTSYTRLCTELWEMVATGIGMMGAVTGNEKLVVDGRIIDRDKAALGRAYGRLAESNETFRRMLAGATSSGAWLEVALVTGSTAGAVWRNHLNGGRGLPVPGPGPDEAARLAVA